MKQFVLKANAAFIALIAAKHGIRRTDFETWAERQINYMLGDNARHASYVVGFGNSPPQRYHHRAS